MCNAPKVGELEKRTGYGGGYMERYDVEYIHREDDSMFDEFGRIKKKKTGEDGKHDQSVDEHGACNEEEEEKVEEKYDFGSDADDEQEKDDDKEDQGEDDLGKYDLTADPKVIEKKDVIIAKVAQVKKQEEPCESDCSCSCSGGECSCSEDEEEMRTIGKEKEREREKGREKESGKDREKDRKRSRGRDRGERSDRDRDRRDRDRKRSRSRERSEKKRSRSKERERERGAEAAKCRSPGEQAEMVNGCLQYQLPNQVRDQGSIMSNLQFQSLTNHNFDMSDESPGGGQSGRIGDRSQEEASTATIGPKKNFFSFSFYQQYFDVDTDQIHKRVINIHSPQTCFTRPPPTPSGLE